MKLLNADAKKFQSYMRGRETICFGAGKYLQTFFSQCPPLGHIKCVVDNDASKWGTIIDIAGTAIEIIPPTQLPSVVNENSLILVTAASVGAEIIQDLMEKEFLRDTPLFYSVFILNEIGTTLMTYKANMPSSFRLTSEPLIPKAIHYAWFGPNPISKEQQVYIDGWKRLCPDYEVKLWNEHNYDVEKNAYMKKAYEKRIWAFVSDYCRKDVVYEHGGIYLDTDVEMIKRPDDLLYQKGFFGIAKGYLIASGLGFGAVKKLPVLKELRDIYQNESFSYRGEKTKATPHYETELFEKYGYVRNGSYQIVANMTIYPYEVLSGSNYINGEPLITPHTYMVHHYAGSWDDGRRKKIKEMLVRMYREFEQI